MENYDTIVERGMKESIRTTTNAMEAAMFPGAIVWERVKPIVQDVFFRQVVRPIFAPKIRFA